MTQRWDEGRYKGKLVEAVMSSIGAKGTPALVLTFDVGGYRKEVRCWLNPEVNPGKKKSALEITEEKLAPMGFNFDYAAPAFTNADDVDLELKYEVYQGKEQERWEFPFVQKPASPAFVEQLNRRARAVHGAPKPAPPGKPLPPPPTKTPPPAAAAAPPGMEHVVDKLTAWEYWTKSLGSEPTETAWHAALGMIGPDEEKFTPEQWRKVALSAIPF